VVEYSRHAHCGAVCVGAGVSYLLPSANFLQGLEKATIPSTLPASIAQRQPVFFFFGCYGYFEESSRLFFLPFVLQNFISNVTKMLKKLTITLGSPTSPFSTSPTALTATIRHTKVACTSNPSSNPIPLYHARMKS
jgi:hypothetical protein